MCIHAYFCYVSNVYIYSVVLLNMHMLFCECTYGDNIVQILII